MNALTGLRRSETAIAARRAISRVRRAAGRRRSAVRQRFRAMARPRVVASSASVDPGALVLPRHLPPVARVARPRIRAAVAAGPRLSAGLAHEWVQTDLTEGEGVPLTGGVAPDVLLVELADPGPGAGWLAGDRSGPVLERALAAAADGRIPTVAWVTVPAPAADRYLALASRFDHVLVVDSLLAQRWAAALGPDRVTQAGAAAQPRIHSPLVPVGERRRPGGAYLHLEEPADEEEAVRAGLEQALGPGARVPIHVWRAREAAQRPSPVGTRRLAGTLPPDRLAHVPARYRVCVDVTGSDGAVRWRVVEAGAAGTPVVGFGPPSAAVDLERAITRTEDPVTFGRHVSVRAQQAERADRDGLRLRRAVLDGHTYGHRVEALLGALGIQAVADRTPSVSAVVPTNRRDEIDNILSNIARQSYRPLELVLVVHGLDLDVGTVSARASELGVDHLAVVPAAASLTLGACMNLGIEAASGRYIAKIDDDNYYGTHYVRDLVRAFDHTEAGIVGKWAHYVWLRSDGAVVLRYADSENRYTRLVQGGTMVIDGELARRLRFSDIPRAVDTDFLTRAAERELVKIYSADRFNFVSVRAPSPAGHTWKVADVDILTGSADLRFYGDPRQHVDV